VCGGSGVALPLLGGGLEKPFVFLGETSGKWSIFAVCVPLHLVFFASNHPWPKSRSSLSAWRIAHGYRTPLWRRFQLESFAGKICCVGLLALHATMRQPVLSRSVARVDLVGKGGT